MSTGAVLSPLLFAIEIEALTQDVSVGLPWELLFADDLVLMAECIEESSKRKSDTMEGVYGGKRIENEYWKD